MVIACYGCLAGPIACLDCTRVIDDLVVVLVLAGVCGLAELWREDRDYLGRYTVYYHCGRYMMNLADSS